MLMIWLIYGLFVFGAATLLNVTAFKHKPASRLAAWSLAFVMFVVSLFALTTLKMLLYGINPKNLFDMAGAFMSAWLFFSVLNRQKKHQPPHPEG